MNDQQSPETEARILDAADRVFTRKGTGGARMADIAEEAGVNQALLHYYFRTKDRLATAVFAKAATVLFPKIAAALQSDLPIQEKIRAVVEAEIDMLRKRPYLPAYLISEMHHHPERLLHLAQLLLPAPLPVLVGGVLAGLQRQIDAEVSAGRMRPIAARELVLNTLALCIFPFAARPALCATLDMDKAGFEAFLDKRRRDVPVFILASLRP